MSTKNPIRVFHETEKYDISVHCNPGGSPEVKWMIIVLITPAKEPETTLSEWHGPTGYATYEAGIEAGKKKGQMLIRELEEAQDPEPDDF